MTPMTDQVAPMLNLACHPDVLLCLVADAHVMTLQVPCLMFYTYHAVCVLLQNVTKKWSTRRSLHLGSAPSWQHVSYWESQGPLGMQRCNRLVQDCFTPAAAIVLLDTGPEVHQ
jgi:hypothetical protein